MDLTIQHLRKAEQIFKEYISHYDIKDGMIYTKVKHSYKVEQNSLRIAEDLMCNQNDIILAGIIGLFHDIGRFEQARIYHNFRDYETIDHADFGVAILKEHRLLDEIVDEELLEIICIAIQYHNKLNIPKDLDTNTNLHCRIIRDADKLDILRLRSEHEEDEGLGIVKEEMENGNISDYVFNTLCLNQMIDIAKRSTRLDGLLTICGFIYDFNFDISYKITYEKQYLENILEYYSFRDEKTQSQINKITQTSNEYLRAHMKQ